MKKYIKKMNKPYLIGISGESGVGKSTIANIVSLFFGIKNTLIISTDDLHKWERNNSAWNDITHLNPEANNLDLGDIHINDLSKNKIIFRSHYNHKTGYFDPPKKIEPKSTIIVEGLHAFYTKKSKSILDLKIFVDTDEDLRIHWKIIRDTEERGYTYNTALESINKRKLDGNKIRISQINDADVIIKLVPENKIVHIGDKNEKINLVTVISYKKEKNKELFHFIENYINEYNKFIFLSETIGNEIEMCQNNGGNISVKLSDQHMIIKSSGFKLKDANKLNAYSILNYKLFLESKIDNIEEFDETIKKSIVSDKYKRPSMETGFHTLLKKYVIHVHPIYITTLLCLKQSKKIIKNIYHNYNYNYINYYNPGFDLYSNIKSQNKEFDILFLENHGIIVSSNEYNSAIIMVNSINNIAKLYIENKIKNMNIDFNLNYSEYELEEKYTFPDAIIFSHDKSKKEINAAHNYINIVGKQLGILRYLDSQNMNVLKNLEAEKYRKTL